MSVDIIFPAQAINPKNDSGIQSILYGGELIQYEIKERKSDINRLLIKVHPDCHVVVLAPKRACNAEIQAAISKRGRWIYTQLKQFKAQLEHVTPRHYIGGESHCYLGKKYVLKIIYLEEKPKVKLLRGSLEITLSSKDKRCQNYKVKMLVKHWYKIRAKAVFSRRLSAMLDQTFWVYDRPPIRLLAMKNQWGNCSRNGLLTLNTHLVKAPRECIDYVILHELCHLVEHNHSPRFYRLMSEVMIDWEEVKERLDGMAEVILNEGK